MSPLEDTWHDIILKAIRGLALDQQSLAQASGVREEKIASLLQGFRNDATLVAIAPSLGLHPRELVMVARGASHPPLTTLPKNVQRFTTLYHGMAVHSYLLWSERTHKAVAFDTGTEITPLLKKLKEHQLDLAAIFLTHAHCDHVLKLSELQAKTKAQAWIDHRELLEGTQPLLDFYSSTFHSWSLSWRNDVSHYWTLSPNSCCRRCDLCTFSRRHATDGVHAWIKKHLSKYLDAPTLHSPCPSSRAPHHH